MNRSEYVIPCVCGATIRSHERETTCPACGRVIALEWGAPPLIVSGKPEEAKP
jgi:hypothetical protein